jgi:signal transduction histidine kinase
MFFQKLRKHIHWLSWAAPISLAILVILYQIGPARWIHEAYGIRYHLYAEILIFGTVGPLLAFLVLHFVWRWLEERETSELQSQVIDKVREQVDISLTLSDHAIQSLFAASILLNSYKQSLPELPSETVKALDETEQALQQIVRQLRGQLQNHPAG